MNTKIYWKEIIEENSRVNFLKNISKIILKNTSKLREIKTTKVNEIVIAYKDKDGEIKTVYIPLEDLTKYFTEE